FDNIVMTPGGNTAGAYGYAQITLLQSLPFLNISSYNSTQATFKADHTDPTLLTKIEYFIDDVLKETITTDLTTEKTINYTLEDNALHTLKIVVTDSNNATAEKVLSISKNIMPLPENVNLNDISTKLVEVNAGFKVGKTSIINTLALKNIEASLNNTLVELSEKIKTSFDSSDASVEELQNRITELTNQLSQRKRYATGVATGVYTNYAPYQITTNLDFTPSIVYIKCNFPYYDYFYVSFSTNLTTIWCNPENDRPFSTRTYISDINSKGFRVRFIKKDGTDLTSLQTVPSQNNITWYAFE
ncbi:hypothetical protein MO286_19825, partial [Clostridioides difficile]|nr:hypothetical protein [Clostridioides difficile]